MARHFQAVLVAVCSLLLAFQPSFCKATQQLEQDIPDAFKAIENFPFAVALYDYDQDGDLDCLTAVRAEYNVEPASATYVFTLRGLNGHETHNVTHYVHPGPTPDTTVFTAEGGKGLHKRRKHRTRVRWAASKNGILLTNEDHVLTAHFTYTDYKKCIIMDLPFEDHQECVLWISKEAKDDVPETCVDKYQDHCSDGVMAYDEESCAGLLE